MVTFGVPMIKDQVFKPGFFVFRQDRRARSKGIGEKQKMTDAKRMCLLFDFVWTGTQRS
jgi:hypothetical protein